MEADTNFILKYKKKKTSAKFLFKADVTHFSSVRQLKILQANSMNFSVYSLQYLQDGTEYKQSKRFL